MTTKQRMMSKILSVYLSGNLISIDDSKVHCMQYSKAVMMLVEQYEFSQYLRI